MLEKTSGHWAYFRQHGTAGFDVHSGRGRGLKEEIAMRLRDAVAALRGETTNRYRNLFHDLWPKGPIKSVPHDTPAAYLAANFANTILINLPRRYEAPTILEIGAGSGYLTHFLLEALPKSRACIIDLTEVLPLSRDNLNRLGTGNRVLFVPPMEAAHIPSFDIAANIASFQEMLPEVVDGYFGVLRSKANQGSVFYCCNRVEKWLSSDFGNSDTPDSVKDIPIRFSDYPWGNEKDVIFRVSQFHRRLAAEPCQERMIEF